MRSKYFFFKFFGILFLVLLVVLYFIAYFFPTLKGLNRTKREIKDINLKISDFVKMENAFSFSDEGERSYFKAAEKELADKIPIIKTREDLIRLYTEISNYIQQIAERDGIDNLTWESDSAEFKVNANTLSKDKKSLDDLLRFTAQRLSRLRHETMQVEDPSKEKKAAGTDSILSTLVKGVKYHTVSLCFTGELNRAANFINHISWCHYYVGENKILVSSGERTPYFIVLLRIFYIDMQQENQDEPQQ